MKLLRFTFVLLVFVASAFQVKAQETVKLSQVDGKFNQTHLTLKAGKYIFEVTNESVDREVGLVVAPQGENGAAGEHIKNAYLANAVKKGDSATSKVVTLEKGTYNYFCPLNPTPHYTITVE